MGSWIAQYLTGDTPDEEKQKGGAQTRALRIAGGAAAADATSVARRSSAQRTIGASVPGSRMPTTLDKLASVVESPAAGMAIPPLGILQLATDAAKKASQGNYKGAAGAGAMLAAAPLFGIPGRLLGEGAQNAERFAVLTAENAGGRAMTAAENAARNASLEAELAQRGYKYAPTVGRYKDPDTGEVLTENGYLVHGIGQREAKLIGKRYGQNGVITQEGYHDLKNNQFFPSKGTSEATDMPYTQLPNGKRFSLDIDWGNPQAPAVNALPVPKNAHPEILRVADELRQGKSVSNLPRVKKVDPEAGAKMAKAYEQLPKSDPQAKSAYDALNNEVQAQYDVLQKAGFKFEFTNEDPYKSSKEMMQDVQQNRRLKVYKTQGNQTHPYMTNEQNDKFRAVHDLLAHAGEGHQFGPTGEENAYRVHASTLSPLAQRALATETRGQNSWVNFGPNADLPAAARPFAEQKAALFPEHLLGEYDTMHQPSMETRASVGGRPPGFGPPNAHLPSGNVDNLLSNLLEEAKGAPSPTSDAARASVRQPPMDMEIPAGLKKPALDSVAARAAERIHGAAIRLPDGRMFVDDTHFGAVNQAQAAGVPEHALEQATEGFTTSSGRFVDRDDAEKIALQSKQIKKPSPYGIGLNAEELYSRANTPAVLTAPSSGDVFDTSKLGLDVPTGVNTDRPPLKRPVRADLSSLKNVPRKMREVYTPNAEKALRENPEAAGWYDMTQVRDAMKDLSPTGEDDFKKLMLFMGPTSIGTKVPDNLRQASMFYKLWKNGELDPEALKAGTLDLPKGYANRRQKSVNAGILKILENGNLDPYTTPKTYRYANQLAGDMWGGAALDMHVGRQVGQRGLIPDAEGELVPEIGFPTPGYSKENPMVSASPSPTQYAHIEDKLIGQAQNLGLTPAQYQALGWVGGGAQTGVSDPRPLLAIFNQKLKDTAAKYGFNSPLDAFTAFAKGQTPLWAALPAAAMGGGLLYDHQPWDEVPRPPRQAWDEIPR